MNFEDLKFRFADSKKQDFSIEIFPDEEEGAVNPLLMGFNVVYSHATDSIWENGEGNIPLLLEKLKTGILRYPGKSKILTKMVKFSVFSSRSSIRPSTIDHRLLACPG